MIRPPEDVAYELATSIHGERHTVNAKRLAPAIVVMCLASAHGGDATPNVVVDRQGIDERVEPVPMVGRFTYEAKDGLILRNGKPFYWTSDGASLGGVHSTPLGLWLAKLHGTTLVSMPHSSCIVRGAERSDGIHLSATIEESYFSWLREAVRLGFLVQAPEGFFHPAQSASLPSLLAKHPHLLESIYDCGHYMGADPADELGLAVLDAKRYPIFTYGGKTGFFMPELNREPGPDPYNNRVKAGFRKWAMAKYGSLEKANGVWRTAFASWDDVVLPHTTGDCAADASSYSRPGYLASLPVVRGIRNKRAEMRAKEKRETPELYWDWILYVQGDITAATRREFEHARRFAPKRFSGRMCEDTIMRATTTCPTIPLPSTRWRTCSTSTRPASSVTTTASVPSTLTRCTTRSAGRSLRAATSGATRQSRLSIPRT